MSDIRLHVSVALLRNNTLLLVQEEKPENFEKWNLPGGHLEDNETILEGACREALEETGLTVTPVGLVGVWRTHRAGYQAARFVYRAVASGEPVAGDQILAVRWFTLAEIEQLPAEQRVAGLDVVASAAFSAAFSGVEYPLGLVVG